LNTETPESKTIYFQLKTPAQEPEILESRIT